MHLSFFVCFVHEIAHYVFAFKRIKSILIGYIDKPYKLIIGFRVKPVKVVDYLAPQFVVPLVLGVLLVIGVFDVTAVAFMMFSNVLMGFLDFLHLYYKLKGDMSKIEKAVFRGIEIRLRR